MHSHRAPVLIAFVLLAGGASHADEPTAAFKRDVVPLLTRKCFLCHEGRDARSGVRLDVRSELLEQELLVPGKSAESRLVEVVSGRDAETVMPPKGPRLKPDEVRILARWIDAGAPWDANVLPLDLGADHWAFQPVRRPPVPRNAGDEWSANPIDAFITARHREQKLTPAPSASRRTLIRRLSLDLIGLPPAHRDVEAFENDDAPDACSRLVERLLASPQYGERWGRHWLDVARWAESEGYESNHLRASAWRYRDYVTRSFNADRPFDEFVRQQVAGDELPQYADENIIATGFLAAARISSNEEDKWLQRNDVNVDIVNAVGNGFLGLTIQCAQCHDHKFDPITTREFYQLQSFFVRGQPVPVRLKGKGGTADSAADSSDEYARAVLRTRELYETGRRRLIEEDAQELSPEQQTALATPAGERTPEQEIMARMADVTFQMSRKRIEEHIPEEHRKEYKALEKEIPKLEEHLASTFAYYSPVTSSHRLLVMPSLGFYPLHYDEDYFREMRPYVMNRGNVHAIGERIRPGWPEVLDQGRQPRGNPTGTKTRKNLAGWLTDPRNPLVARVWVNRIWAWHFGRGLVATVDDFGLRGARPSHPQLLDWLACELIESGRSTKHIHRLILNSQTFRQSARVSAATRERDPDNVYLTRWNTRRLDSEVIRDALLFVSGQFDMAVGGPSILEDERETARRRSLYLFQRRGRPDRMTALFDGPNECAASRGKREVSTSPLQALYLLNGEFGLNRARAIAAAVRDEVPSEPDGQIETAFQKVLARSPRDDERRAALELIEKVASSPANADGLEVLCHSLLNLNEFVYVE